MLGFLKNKFQCPPVVDFVSHHYHILSDLCLMIRLYLICVPS
jgi:hypothetical protein